MPLSCSVRFSIVIDSVSSVYNRIVASVVSSVIAGIVTGIAMSVCLNFSPSSSYSFCRSKGFTLVEMMTVIVIAAIIFSIGIPSFDDLVKRNSVESLQMKLAGAISTARTEASSRNTVVSICPSNDAASCSGTWNDGWITFEDKDADGTLDAAEIVVDVYEHDSNYTFTAANSAGGAVSLLSFTSQGYMQGTDSTLFTICEPNSRVKYARGLFVNASGLMIKTNDGGDADTSHDNPFTGGEDDPTDLGCPTT